MLKSISDGENPDDPRGVLLNYAKALTHFSLLTQPLEG